MSDIILTLNASEQQALSQLLDMALRQAGLGAFDVVAHFRRKVIAAQETAQPVATPVSDPK